MKNPMVRKVVIIFSVLTVTVLAAVIVAFATGNSAQPRLSDPNGIFYERTDAEGNVIYTITNQELFDEIKGNDGIDQLLYMIDSYLLQTYVAHVTDAEIADKIQLLTYGTDDDDEIAELDAEDRETYETTFAQSMILAGYSGHEEDYARIVLAREAYVRFAIDNGGEITDLEVAQNYVSAYYEDVMAIKIRFTSSADALDVMRHFNLVTFNSTTIREYLGYVFAKESETWDHDGDGDTPKIVADAYITVSPYYFNADENLVSLDGTIVYESEGDSVYSRGTAEYTLQLDGDLVDEAEEVVIAASLIYNTQEAAQAYKDANSEYFTLTKDDNFDDEEEAELRNAAGDLLYTVDSDNKIYDLAHELVTDSGITLNKSYKPIATMGTVTVNNSAALTADEVLTRFIAMYNYVYAETRDAAELLDPAADRDDLIASDNPHLTHVYTELKAVQQTLATYLFKTIDISDEDNIPYSASAKSYPGANDTNYYLVYKLTQPAKVDVYNVMLDLIEGNIHLPAETVDDLELPTTGWYSAKITWTSEDEDVITDDGVVTLPTEAAEDIDMTYKITANGVTRTGKITVKVLVSGTTSEVDDTDPGVAPTFRELLNDPTLYGRLYQGLLDAEMTNPDTSAETITSHLATLRAEHGFRLYDRWMTIDYQAVDTEFEGEEKGSKTLIAAIDSYAGYLGAAATDGLLEITADELFAYAMTKNVSLYVLYASQFKELLYSPFFTEAFGTQTDLERNNTDRMEEMYTSVQDAKDYYSYLQQLYASYGIDFTYGSFSEYAYQQYGVKTEAELLQYFVQGELQPYLINEAVVNYDLVELLYPTVVDFYENFFSLSVTHLIIHLDFDENGTPDDYFAYVDGLDVAEADLFETKLAGFEAAITEYLDDEDNDFETLVSAYNAATRTDATWGEFKRFGFLLMTENLDFVDEEDDSITYALNYSGEHGVKDTYVQEYVDALIALYAEYRLEQNQNLTNMMSSLVTTKFGQHLILVEPGDDFDGFSAAFEEADPENPVYTEGSENAADCPTLEQVKLYALYYFYNTVYDLTDADVEELYGITVPKLPAAVKTALEFYFDDLCADLYVVGTLNVTMADRLAEGAIDADAAAAFAISDAAFKAGLSEVQDVYYEALFGQYVE